MAEVTVLWVYLGGCGVFFLTILHSGFTGRWSDDSWPVFAICVPWFWPLLIVVVPWFGFLDNVFWPWWFRHEDGTRATWNPRKWDWS